MSFGYKGSRDVPKLTGLGFELSGERKTGGGGTEEKEGEEGVWGGGGRFIWTTSLSYLTRGEGPTTFKIGIRQWTPRLRGEKLEHHIQAALSPNQPSFPTTILLRHGRLFYVTMTLNLIH